MVLFSTRFPFSTALWELKVAPQRLAGLNGHKVWRCSWGAIILGTLLDEMMVDDDGETVATLCFLMAE